MLQNDLEILHSRTAYFVLQSITEWRETMVVKRTTLQGKDEFLLIHTPSEEILMFFPLEVFKVIEPHLIVNALGHSKTYDGITGYSLI